MKTISKKTITKTVKKEYKEAREWCHGDWGRYYQLMIDTDDGDIWADVFLSENSWSVYHSCTIFPLEGTGRTVKEREDAYITDAIRALKEAGWTITE